MPRFRSVTTVIHVLFAVAFASCALGTGPARSAELRVAVAANFRWAATALTTSFERQRDTNVVLISAATGVLATQWRRGAPFDLLLAADRRRPENLARDGLVLGEPRCYALGALVLLGATDVHRALSDPDLSIAIGNPVSAPYGTAALAVLGRPEFSGAAQRRILRGGNVMQAQQFFASGAADLALVARSLSIDAGLPIPQSWHEPIEQYAIVNPRSRHPEIAKALLDHLTGPGAQASLPAFGYQACP